MLESILQVAVPLSLLVISVIGFFIKKTLSTIEEAQFKFNKNLTEIHMDFQISKNKFESGIMSISKDVDRAHILIDDKSKIIFSNTERINKQDHDVTENKNNLTLLFNLVKDDTKRINEIEKDLITVKSKI